MDFWASHYIQHMDVLLLFFNNSRNDHFLSVSFSFQGDGAIRGEQDDRQQSGYHLWPDADQAKAGRCGSFPFFSGGLPLSGAHCGAPDQTLPDGL